MFYKYVVISFFKTKNISSSVVYVQVICNELYQFIILKTLHNKYHVTNMSFLRNFVYNKNKKALIIILI